MSVGQNAGSSGSPSPAEAPGRGDRLTKGITVFIAFIAATAVVSGFLNNLESSRVNQETRAGLAAQSLASERSIQVGRIFDADFDYLVDAEVHAFIASELDAQSLFDDAARERAIALYLLQSTYGYADGYYSDALVENAVDAYGTVGFDGVWDAFTGYADELQAEVDARQLEADAHLAAASDAGRRASGFILSTVLMAVAVSISPVALASPLRALRLWDLAIITALYAIGGLNLAWTFAT